MNARRGRPPAYDRDIALGAIASTFLAKGFSATSLDDITQATGMNRPSLFSAFGNKKAMYLAALDRFEQDMAQAVRPALATPGPPAQAIGAFFDAAVRFYCAGPARGCLLFCTAVTEAPSDCDIRDALTGALQRIEDDLTQRLEQATEGAPLPQTLASRVKMLRALLVDVAIEARLGLDEATLRADARSAALLILTPAA